MPDTRNADGAFVEHVRAADVGLSMGRRWVEVVIILVGIGIGIERLSGKVERADQASAARSEAVAKSLDDFKIEVREKLKNVDTTNGDNRELRTKLEEVTKRVDAIDRNVSENYKIMMTYQSQSQRK